MKSNTDKLRDYFKEENPDLNDFPVKEWEHFYKSRAFRKIIEFQEEFNAKDVNKLLLDTFGIALTSQDIGIFAEELSEKFMLIQKLTELVEEMEVMLVASK